MHPDHFSSNSSLGIIALDLESGLSLGFFQTSQRERERGRLCGRLPGVGKHPGTKGWALRS